MTASDNSEAAGREGSWLASAVSRRQFFVGAAGAAAVAGLSACSGTTPSSQSSGSSSSSAAGTPKKGGNFRLGVTGGGASDIIDGQSIVTKPDQTRLIGSWETLMTYDEDYVLGTDGLAEEVDSSVPGQVDVRLRSGIEFHNGKTLTADDVISSIKRILNPKEGLFGAAGLGSVDPSN